MYDTKIRVLIAEDMEPLRRKYVTMLSQYDEIEVIADVGTGVEACQLALKLSPDVILMDIEMETKDAGIRAISSILTDSPEILIIVLTIYEEDDTVFSAFQLGACDYLLKNSKQEELGQSIIAAYNNQSSLHPEIANKLRTEFRRIKTYESSFLFMLNILITLTPRELDTLYLLSNGYTRREVCEKRCIEMSTVKTQIRSILKKFNKRNIQDVITTEADKQLLGLVLNQK
jgi:DNA-binding NarL/FixJ family response regulator